MNKRYYQTRTAIYQLAIDGDSSFYLYKMKQPLAITSEMNAWEYLKRFTDKAVCEDALMQLLSVNDPSKLQSKEISEEKVQKTILEYKAHNSY